MYRIGLKLWSTNTDNYLHEAERLYEEGVFSYIELYVVPDSLEHLPTWKKLKIPFIIHNAHFMQHFNLAKKECEENNRRIYRETRQYADELNAPHIIFHGGVDGCIEETARQLAAFHEPRALIENKPFRALANQMGGGFCRGYNAVELKTVIEATGCGFCFDFGHAVCVANSFSREPYEYLREMASLNPAMYHLTDIDDIHSEFDSHLHLGKGQFILGKVIGMIRPGSFVTLETNKDFKNSLDDFPSDAAALKFYDMECALATDADAEAVFKLSNDPLVRRNSFSLDVISWETHVDWFRRKLASNDCSFYLIRNLAGELAAQIRFERVADGSLQVSISVAPAFRGKHYACTLLHCAITRLKNNCAEPHLRLTAWVKNENAASLKCFSDAGFVIFEKNDEKTGFQYAI